MLAKFMMNLNSSEHKLSHWVDSGILEPNSLSKHESAKSEYSSSILHGTNWLSDGQSGENKWEPYNYKTLSGCQTWNNKTCSC